MKYAWIEQHRSTWPLHLMCKVLGVSTSGYFASRREAMDEVIDWFNFYNSERLHSTLRYISTMQFEAKWFAAQQPKAA